MSIIIDYDDGYHKGLYMPNMDIYSSTKGILLVTNTDEEYYPNISEKVMRLVHIDNIPEKMLGMIFAWRIKADNQSVVKYEPLDKKYVDSCHEILKHFGATDRVELFQLYQYDNDCWYRKPNVDSDSDSDSPLGMFD